jgi:hypothetical protein
MGLFRQGDRDLVVTSQVWLPDGQLWLGTNHAQVN